MGITTIPIGAPQRTWVEFPIFDAKSRSLKKAVLGKGRNNSICIESVVITVD